MYSNPKIEDSNSKSHLATIVGFVAKSGMSNSALSHLVFTGNSYWIIDKGATDHMTCDRYKFSHLSSSCSKSAITNVNDVSL